MLCHFLFPIISHNVGIINPRKCGFISLRLDVKMKCELIGQVYATAEAQMRAGSMILWQKRDNVHWLFYHVLLQHRHMWL